MLACTIGDLVAFPINVPVHIISYFGICLEDELFKYKITIDGLQDNQRWWLL
jgi:hypothetical protein